MTDRRRTVKAATFRLWYELLEEAVGHDPDDVAPGNRWSAVILLHDLIGVGLRNGAIRPIVIHSSGPDSYAHLMFRYTLTRSLTGAERSSSCWTAEIPRHNSICSSLRSRRRLVSPSMRTTGEDEPEVQVHGHREE